MVNDAAQTDCVATPTIYLRRPCRPTSDRVAKTSPAGLQSFGFISDDLSDYMTGDLSGYNQFVRVTRRTKRQREKANSPVVQVVQLESPLERLSDCRTVPYLRFFLVRNEEAGGSNPLSSTIFQKGTSSVHRGSNRFVPGRRRFGLSGCYGESLCAKSSSTVVRTLPRHWLESHTVTANSLPTARQQSQKPYPRPYN